MTQRSNIVNLLLILFMGSVLLYPSLNIYFVSDNIGHIVNAAENLKQLDYRYFRPLPVLSLFIDYHLWGDDYMGYHLTNLLLHLMMTAGVYLLALAIVRSRFFAISAAFLFLLHPIHSLALFWISGRTDMICGIFYIGALLFFIRYFKTEDLRYRVVTISLFILALLSKEMSVSLPVIALSYVLIFEPGRLSQRLREGFRMTTFLWIILIVYLVFRLVFIGNAMLENADHNVLNPLQLAKNLVIYLGLLIIPGGHIEIARYLQTHPFLFISLVIFALILLTIGFSLLRHSKILLFTVVFVLISLLPVLRLVMRWYLYLPSVGICLGIAYLMFLVNRSKRRIFVLSYGGILLTCWIYAIFLLQEQQRWVDAGELARDYTRKAAALIAGNNLQSCFLLNVPGELAEVPVAMFGLESFINFRLQREFKYQQHVSVKRISYLSLQSKADFENQEVRRIDSDTYDLSLFRTGAHFFFPHRTDVLHSGVTAGMVIEAPEYYQQIEELNKQGKPIQLTVQLQQLTSPLLIYRRGTMEMVLPDSSLLVNENTPPATHP